MTRRPGNAATPQDYEALVRLIHERFEHMSKANRSVAEFVVQHPNEMAIGSVSALAKKCGVHATSFVRFAQSLGYSGFRELQETFELRMITVAPGFEARAARLRSQIAEQVTIGPLGHLQEIALRDIAAIEDLMESIPAQDLERAVTLLHKAETIYLLAQLRSQPIALLLQYLLTMIGRKTVLLDAPGGLATHMARSMTPSDVLFAVSFRFYATEVVNITEEAAARSVPIVAFSDTSLSPLAKSADVLFAMPEPDYTFSRSLAAPMCLAQALTIGVAARQSDDGIQPRIPVATQGSEFDPADAPVSTKAPSKTTDKEEKVTP